MVASAVGAQHDKGEPIFTADDLYARCTSSDRAVCVAYIRGFSDGNRWLLRDASVGASFDAAHAVCVPNREPISGATDLFVARFKGRRLELAQLSPYRALSLALSGRYPCDDLLK